jgi:hypothetical protein
MTADRTGNTERLVAIGKAVFGERWQRRMAKELKTNQAQVYRWVHLHYEPDAKVMYQAEEIMRRHMAELAKVARAGKE